MHVWWLPRQLERECVGDGRLRRGAAQHGIACGAQVRSDDTALRVCPLCAMTEPWHTSTVKKTNINDITKNKDPNNRNRHKGDGNAVRPTPRHVITV